MTLAPAHLEVLQSFGYTRQEAYFLYLVATHSGYFLARQFLGFTRAHWRSRTTRFCAKLRSKKHARSERFPSYGLVYHVFAQKLYRHLDRENVRNHREHELEHVQRRIAMFDFVLTYPDFAYLETELEKRVYFEQKHGIPLEVLPSRTYHGHTDEPPTVRYFVDRFPMFVENAGSSPVVAFSYIQPAEANLTGFAGHLRAYLPLFREVPAFRFLYLARHSAHFERARELFDSLVTIPLGSNPVDDLLRYFAIRKAWDLRQYSGVSEADLIFRNRAKQRFAAPRFEDLYREWKNGRAADAQVRAEFPASTRSHQIQFTAELLKTAGTKERTGETPEN
jgi:hypothetical protein